MTKLYSSSLQFRIRLCITYNLIFFAIILAACKDSGTGRITVVFENQKAVGIQIPQNLLKDLNKDSLDQFIAVRLDAVDNRIPVLGNYSLDNHGAVRFSPLVPLSKGSSYVVYYHDKVIGAVKVPPANPADKPSVIQVFPTVDTLPENLLKIYIQFSKPMQEGMSGQYVYLVKNKRDTLSGIFLDLQPELWSDDGTVLTMWLDPGRIKRGLQPNTRLGNPLIKGERYEVVVSDAWKAANGLKLTRSFHKTFYTGDRDSISPRPSEWRLKLPQKSTKDSFEADFGESLDFYLIGETIQILNDKSRIVEGKLTVKTNETGISFSPSAPWISGIYKMVVQTKLEDLAGNNVNRPFDRDIKNSKVPGTDAVVVRSFQIK